MASGERFYWCKRCCKKIKLLLRTNKKFNILLLAEEKFIYVGGSKKN